jgi:nucleoside-diphosphate-sugar epimerase
MDILISGCCGCIGTSLTLEFLKQGHNVLGIDNFITSNKDKLTLFENYKTFKFDNADISKINGYQYSTPNAFSHIYHFASPASPIKYLKYPQETIDANIIGTRNLLNLALFNNAKFMFASTSEIYGDPEKHPQKESYNGNVNPACLRSVYDESKRMGETLTNLYNKQYGVDTKIIRIFNTYSPYIDLDDGRIISNFIKAAKYNKPIEIYGNGLQTRSLQYVDDLVAGIIKLTEIKYNDPINLGNEDEYTVLDIAKIIKNKLFSRSKIIHKDPIANDPCKRRPNISLAKEILNWEPKISFKEGLDMVLENEFFNHHLSLTKA